MRRLSHVPSTSGPGRPIRTLVGKRIAGRVSLALVAALAGACAAGGLDPFAEDHALEASHKHYTRLVRWAEFDRAGEYVAPELRDAYRARTAGFAHVRFTDYEVRAFEVDPHGQEATVRVTYSAYSLATATTVALEERQHWYRETETNRWRVRPVFEESPAPGAPHG